MKPTKPNTSENTTDQYKAVVREYLRNHGEFASKEELRAELTIPDWYVDDTSFRELCYTSLTHRGKYVASKYIIGHRADRQGFWRPAEADEDIVFHQQASTKETLTYLALNRPAGLTATEAKELLARPCYRALDDLVEEGRIVDQSVAGTRCFVHPWQDNRETQVTERQSEVVEDISPSDDPGDDEYLYLEEILESMNESAAESVQSIRPARAATLVLRQLHGDTFRAVERRLRHNDRLQEPLGYADPTEVPDSTTIWRAHDDVAVEELREWLQEMCTELLADAEQSGRYAVVDATDIDAWANTRQEIDNGDVEGASWGKHEGSFYGYKVFIVVDVAIEQPILIRMETGKRYDSPFLIPLLEEYEQRYDTDALEAVLADAAYDSADNRDACAARLGCRLLHPINPRTSTRLKAIKQEIAQIFTNDEDGEIETVDDVYERLAQTTLDDYGVELGNPKDSYIYDAIKERLHRAKRACVERVFARLQEFAGLNHVRTQQEDNVETHVVLSAVALVGTALTAKRVGKPELMRSPSRIL